MMGVVYTPTPGFILSYPAPAPAPGFIHTQN